MKKLYLNSLAFSSIFLLSHQLNLDSYFLVGKTTLSFSMPIPGLKLKSDSDFVKAEKLLSVFQYEESLSISVASRLPVSTLQSWNRSAYSFGRVRLNWKFADSR